MKLLRQDLLSGSAIALAGSVSAVLVEKLVALGARAELFGAVSELDDDGALQWARARAPLDALVHDAGAAFGGGGQAGLLAALEDAWVAVAAVANGALIPADRGKLVLIAPRPVAGAHAQAARCALENLARTLSVEWARYGITATAIAPGAASTDAEVAALVAFLLSRAGDYFSGCRFELGSVA